MVKHILEGFTVIQDNFWIGSWSRIAQHIVLSEAVEFESIRASVLEFQFPNGFVAAFSVAFSVCVLLLCMKSYTR